MGKLFFDPVEGAKSGENIERIRLAVDDMAQVELDLRAEIQLLKSRLMQMQTTYQAKIDNVIVLIDETRFAGGAEDSVMHCVRDMLVAIEHPQTPPREKGEQ